MVVAYTKKYKKRAAHAAAMGSRNKKQKINTTAMRSSTTLTVSPELDNTNDVDGKKNVTNDVALTNGTKPKKNNLIREINELHKDTRDRSNEYLKKCSGNRLVHWDSLKSLISTYTVCKVCGSSVYIDELTTGIATQIKLTCQNQRCTSKNLKNEVKRTIFKKEKVRVNDPAESYAINCQFVLCLIQNGCGSTEGESLMTYLDLPNAPSFKKKTFARIQEKMRPEIKQMSNKCLEDARNEEIERTIGEEMFKKFEKKELHASQVPLTVMYDMGWNKRSSGNKYDSISGHGFLLGGNSRKILNYRCMSKCCKKCTIAERMKQEPMKHECPKNHQGSSKSMECEAIYLMVKDSFYNQQFTCSVIVSDDDSTMKSNLKHSWEQKIKEGKMTMDEWPRTARNQRKKDNGRLPLDIPEPSFLADFNHRVKTVGKSVYALAMLPKRDSDVTKPIAERIKTYWGTMLKQIRYLKWEDEREKIEKKVLAPIEHLFQNHDYCDEQWCYVLQAQKEKKNYVPEESRPLYTKNGEPKMYQQLTDAVARFQTEKNIRECLHKYDTQINEGLNMTVSRYVPKFKHYGTTMSLDTRIRCVIGQHNMGYANYYSTLLKNLGCIENNDDKSYLSQGIARIGQTKYNNRIHKQKVDVKRRRKYGQLAKTTKQILEERIDRAQKMGTYEAGVAILGEQNDTQQSSTNEKRQQTKVCNSCGGKGHKTFRTKSCPNHQQYLQSKATKKPVEPNKNKPYLNMTGSRKEKVRNENEDKGDDVVGIESAKGDFGVASLDADVRPSPDAPDVVLTASPSKKKSAGECLKLYDFVCDEKNKQKKIDVVQPVSRTVGSVPDQVSVLHNEKISTSTGVDYTQEISKKKDDSLFCFEHPVQTCVEISNNLDVEQSDFEYDLDINSEISFIDDLNAV